MNKHLINLCYVQGEPISKNPKGKVVRRAAGSISFEMDGTFHRSQDLLNTNLNSSISLSGSHSVPSGKAHIYIGKLAFDSLLEATFKEDGKILMDKDFQMKIEDLNDMVDGYTNAFEEENDVKISAQIDNVFAV